MPDRYGSFHELGSSEREGEDWAREYEDRGSRILVMAPHGGWIEPFTTELARAVAGEDLSMYSFRGLTAHGTDRLHLTSHRFDEPLAAKAVEQAEGVLAIHGEKSRDRPFIMVGGRWALIRDRLREALGGAGFPVEPARRGLGGLHPRNVCNRGRFGAGGQLEISEGLRDRLRGDRTELHRFVEVVRSVLLELESTPDWGSGTSRIRGRRHLGEEVHDEER